MARGKQTGKSAVSLIVVIIAVGVALMQAKQGAQPASNAPGASPSAPSSPPRVQPAGGASVPTPSASRAAAGASPSDTIRIASWNIEWLGKPEDRSGAGRDVAQDPADLADYITASRADIVALQEIVSRERGTPIRSRELEAVIAQIKSRTGAAWEYVLFPGRADGDQLTGVMWNTSRVTALDTAGGVWDQSQDKPWAVPIPRGRSAQGSALWNRPPNAMKFSAGEGRTDIVVISVHMKADFQGDFAEHRAEEAAALVNALPAVRKAFKDDDIVIIGDTNCTDGPEPALDALARAGFADLNAAGHQTHWQGGTMDRAFVPKNQPEFASSSFEVLSEAYLGRRGLTPRDFKRGYSDHYLVVSTVQVRPDDD